MDRTLSGATIPSWRGRENDGNEEVLCIISATHVWGEAAGVFYSSSQMRNPTLDLNISTIRIK